MEINMLAIGEGNFSKVYLDMLNGEKVVRKIFKSGCGKEAKREYLFLKTLKHCGTVKALGYFDEEEPQLILEYIPEKLPKCNTPLQAESLIISLIKSLIKIHNAGIVLNDIKPENIGMLRGEPVFLDLGLATTSGFLDNRFRGSLVYSSPEKIKTNYCNRSADVFALGMLWYFLESGSTFLSDLSIDEYKEILLDERRWNVHIDKIENDIIKKMLTWRAADRIDLIEVLADLNVQDNEFSAKNYVFNSQVALAEKLISEKSIVISPLDEPERIAELAALMLETFEEKFYIIDQKKYIINSDIVINNLGFNTENEFYDRIKSGVKLILIKRRFTAQLSFLVNENQNIYCIEVDIQQSGMEIENEEIEKFIKLFPQVKKHLTKNEVFPVKTLKSLTIQQNLKTDESLLQLIQLIPGGVSISLLEQIIPNWYDLMNGLIQNDILRINGSKVTLVEKFKADYDKSKLNEYIAKIHETNFNLERAFLYYSINDIKNSEVMFDRVVIRMIKENRMFSGLEFLRWLIRDYPVFINSFALNKRYAFLLRRNKFYDESLVEYNKLINRESGARLGILLSDRAVVYNDKEEYDKAIDDLREASDLLSNDGSDRDYFRVTNNLAYTAYQQKKFHKALRAFKEIYAKSQEVKIVQWEIISLINIAGVNLTIGNWKRALMFAKKVFALSEKTNRAEYLLLAGLTELQASVYLDKLDNLQEKIDDILGREILQENAQIREECFVGLFKIFICSKQTSEEVLMRIGQLVKGELVSLEAKMLKFWYCFWVNNFEGCTKIANETKDVLLLSVLNFSQKEILNQLMQMINNDQITDAGIISLILLRKNIYNDNFKKKLIDVLEFTDFSYEESVVSQSGVELDFVWGLIREIIQGNSFKEVVRITLRSLLRIGKMERAIYYRKSNEGYVAEVFSDSLFSQNEIKISRTILQKIESSKGISFLDDLLADDFADKEGSVFGLGLRSAVGFPFVVDGKLVGIFYSDTKSENRFSSNERLFLEVIFTQSGSILKNKYLEDKIKSMSEIPQATESFHGMIANSPQMLKIFEQIKLIGKHNVNVLITGETGTGKELVAKAIHNEYAPKEPFVAVNCAAIPEHLIESELFGYKAGAFTGATSERKGLFVSAGKGTIFLDEIGEMPIALQPKVLRVLQEREIVPLGSSKPIKVNMRVVAATHRDLKNEVENGKFRQDLLYRLSVMPIRIPALRERIEDLPLLIKFFIDKYNKKFGKKISNATPDYLQALSSYKWQGNIRELENEIEKSILLCSSDSLDVETPSQSKDGFIDEELMPIDWKEFKRYKKQLIAKIDEKYADKILLTVDGNISKAARLAGFDRAQIYRLKPAVTKK
jgi:two-component system response regulator PilR (NtrC family)